MRIIVPTLAAFALCTALPQALSAAEPDPMVQAAAAVIADEERETLVETSHRIAFTLQACDAAKDKIQDQAAQDLMAMIRSETLSIHKELGELMRTKAVPTPALAEDYREDLAEIREAEAEDAYDTYREYQLEVSSDLVDVLEEASQDAKDADLRAFAVRWLPAAQHHVQVLEAYTPVR